MVRGENVMHGYWRNAEETARVLKDGWLHTGDIGHFDDKGRIVITDRKKDMIVNDKGDNVSPQQIEGMLTLQPEIAQAMVYGDRRPHLVALLVPDPEIASKADVHARLQTRGRPRQCGSVGDRKGAPLHPRRRALHDRERANHAIDEDPPPRHRKGYGERLDALYDVSRGVAQDARAPTTIRAIKLRNVGLTACRTERNRRTCSCRR